MHYDFPIIQNISDVIPIISNKEEFFVNEKQGYKTINYRISHSETFPDIINEPLSYKEKNDYAILRECRGIKFEELSGAIICRPFQKFFNLGEKKECFPHNLDLSHNHIILQKLDGSLIAPFLSNGCLIWGSKMGETFLSQMIQQFVNDKPQYTEMVLKLINSGFTPSFEYTSPLNRIVIGYKEETLTLLAIRNMITGSYVPYDGMVKLASMYNIPVVQCLHKNIDDIESFVTQHNSIVGEEGYVVRFNSGYMIKIKFSDYVLKHKVKDDLSLEKNVIPLILNETIDDFLPILNDDDKEKVESFRKSLLSSCLVLAQKVENMVGDAKELYGNDKKLFALNVANRFPQISSLLFSVHKEEDPFQTVKNMVLKQCISQSSVDKCREIVGWKKWNDVYQSCGEG